jgi:anti-sigma factor ChrR (cupin superfamily)
MDIKDQEQMLEQAALYALGALNTDEVKAFEQLLASDERLRAECASFNGVMADLAMCTNEAVPPHTTRETLLARIAKIEQKPKVVLATASKTPALNVDIRAQEGNWMQLAEKVFCKTLFVDPQSGLVTSLVKLEPGGYLPRHRHLGVEQTLVVEGDCVINGQVFYPGDYRVRACNTEDGAVTTEHGTLIMLIAPERCEILDPSWPC